MCLLPVLCVILAVVVGGDSPEAVELRQPADDLLPGPPPAVKQTLVSQLISELLTSRNETKSHTSASEKTGIPVLNDTGYEKPFIAKHIREANQQPGEHASQSEEADEETASLFSSVLGWIQNNFSKVGKGAKWAAMVAWRFLPKRIKRRVRFVCEMWRDEWGTIEDGDARLADKGEVVREGIGLISRFCAFVQGR